MGLMEQQAAPRGMLARHRGASTALMSAVLVGILVVGLIVGVQFVSGPRPVTSTDLGRSGDSSQAYVEALRGRAMSVTTTVDTGYDAVEAHRGAFAPGATSFDTSYDQVESSRGNH